MSYEPDPMTHEDDEIGFGKITITNVLRGDKGVHHVAVDFGSLSVIEVFGMLEMARLQAYQHALGLMEEEQ